MGSVENQDALDSIDEVTVLVTGYGKFMDEYPDNPSWLIASSLPDVIEATASHPTRIKLRLHPEAIKVAYETVLDLVPKLLSPSTETPTPDFVLHLGLAGKRDWFALERGAHKSGYGKKRDMDKNVYEDGRGESHWPGFPAALQTGFDVEDAISRWQKLQKGSPSAKVRDADLRISQDAGDYLCGFIYYNSLAWFYGKRKEKGDEHPELDLPVAFSHVPPLTTDEDVEMGRLLIIELIRALVQSKRQERTGGRKMRGSRPLQHAQIRDAN